MRNAILPAIVVIVTVLAADAVTQQVVKQPGYEITLPDGWSRTSRAPQGFEVGFRKALPDAGEATLYLHHEVMPPEAGEPPSDTSDMKRQWGHMVSNQYPDAREVTADAPKVGGRVLINGTYELTDGGTKVRRRYTYFLSGKTAFVVQCSAPPSQWTPVLKDFDRMLASLSPGASTVKRETKSDDSAKAELQRGIPTLLASFPPQWACSLSGIVITLPASDTKRTLEIQLVFERPDVQRIYDASRQLFAIIKAGASDSNVKSMPTDLQAVVPESGEFVKYIGQVWGYASYAANCEPPIQQYKITVADSKGSHVGFLSISREDASAILTGKVTASDTKRLAGMYVFETVPTVTPLPDQAGAHGGTTPIPAQERVPCVPKGFHAAPGTGPEPYTNTGWAKKVIHDKTGIEMLFIPAGGFDMGSPPSEVGRYDNEGPVHHVQITKPFYLGKCEVTNAEYRLYQPSHDSGNYDTLTLNGDRQPVSRVSWNDAEGFSAWAGLELPTEAEWEYACRAGTSGRFWWGESETDAGQHANIADKTLKAMWPHWSIGDTDDGNVVTANVGSYDANGFGLYDMQGNVCELCADWYGAYVASPAKDPFGPSSGSGRVRRGGSWGCTQRDWRSAVRGQVYQSNPDADNGFRVRLALDDAAPGFEPGPAPQGTTGEATSKRAP